MNKEIMFKSYELLFEIETSLVDILETKMKNVHGPIWRRIFCVEGRTYLHDTIATFSRFETLHHIFSHDELRKFRTLINIRNKICHMTLITYDEFQKLRDCHSIILDKGARQYEVTKKEKRIALHKYH